MASESQVEQMRNTFDSKYLDVLNSKAGRYVFSYLVPIYLLANQFRAHLFVDVGFARLLISNEFNKQNVFSRFPRPVRFFQNDNHKSSILFVCFVYSNFICSPPFMIKVHAYLYLFNSDHNVNSCAVENLFGKQF